MKRHLFIAAALTGTLALAGCDNGEDTEQAAQDETTSQAEQPQEETTSQAEQPQEAEQQASQTLQGMLEFAATETPLPEEAEVTVSLREVAEADAPATVITETTVTPEDGEPVEFALDYDVSAVTADHAHILQATLRDGDDNLRWTTKERHTVEVGPDAEQGPITLVLEPVTSEAAGDENLQEAQQDMLESDDAAGASSDTADEASGESMEAIDEQATEMQEPTTSSEGDATTAGQ
ncbi:YbaY family lipoprotein [Halomonas maura]|uniref:YbaY family lipoprotein n=1 Tax=Halomonas maura TaxID=117606 RepID=UPI0025B3FC8F|nr:YbaY family lipoprotein [Halomonas maura]MDN3557962.1 YbaY family lipoprotein [Halomonas maura]